jgi:hypothetical protein
MASHFSGRPFGRRRPATQVKTAASELKLQQARTREV